MQRNKLKDVQEWFIFPSKSLKEFRGYGTRDDITYMRGFFPSGQNIKFTNSNTPTQRDGSELVGTQAGGGSVNRAWVFERRDGTIIEMKAYDTGVYVYISGVSSDYALLKGGFTSGLEFCYGVLSESGNTYSQVQFCNGTDNWQQWRGVYGLYASDNASDQITISGSTSLSDLGFPATGTMIINGTEITYTGLSDKTFTGCSAVPSSPTVGDIILASPTDMTGSGVVKAQVASVYDGRLHARSEAKQSVSYYSKLDNPDDWTAGSTDGDGGAKELEQGGAIKAYGKDEETIYIFKKRLIKTLQFIQSGDRVDVPKWGTLKPADDKSTTIGAIGQKSTFHAPNGVIFITEDKQMLYLTRKEQIDYPQLIDISDDIKPTFQAGVHDEASGIVFNNKVYYAYKQDDNSTYNDTVIVYDLIRRKWDVPYIGWNVSDWTIVNNELRWHSSTNSDSFKVITDKTDQTLGFTSSLRTWAEHFDSPELQKKCGYIFLEIYMQENSEITLTVLYDEDGYSGQEIFKLSGDEDQKNKIDSESYNPFGASAFGTERFGSNADISGLKKYRYLIELKKNVEFYNISLDFANQKAGDNFEIIRFGWYITEKYLLPNYNYLK